VQLSQCRRRLGRHRCPGIWTLSAGDLALDGANSLRFALAFNWVSTATISSPLHIRLFAFSQYPGLGRQQGVVVNERIMPHIGIMDRTWVVYTECPFRYSAFPYITTKLPAGNVNRHSYTNSFESSTCRPHMEQ
jgi:hypothetical protein